MNNFEIGGISLSPGNAETIELEVSVLANSTRFDLPVHIRHGEKPGPVFFMSAAIHGDEIQGVEIIRRVLVALANRDLAGTILAVPIVNSFGFLTHSRYMPDRRDLNRSFPGSDRGSLASLLADLFFEQVVSRAQFGIDFHTAALHRSNLPQIRVAPGEKALLDLAKAFGPPVIVNSKLRDGSLRQAAAQIGVQMLLYEGGEALRFDEIAIEAGVQGTLRLMQHLGMIAPLLELSSLPDPAHASTSAWLRAPEGGILHALRKSGDHVEIGDELGIVTDPLGQSATPIIAEDSGIIIGHTNLPIVNRGDALFHLAKLKPSQMAANMPDEDEII
jgi:predicted deacylase